MSACLSLDVVVTCSDPKYRSQTLLLFPCPTASCLLLHQLLQDRVWIGINATIWISCTTNHGDPDASLSFEFDLIDMADPRERDSRLAMCHYRSSAWLSLSLHWALFYLQNQNSSWHHHHLRKGPGPNAFKP